MTVVAHESAQRSAAAELRRGTSSVRVAAAAGAPIVSYCANDHDWCAAGPWFDYAPTSAACSLPTFVTGAPKGAFPEGGLLASEEPQLEVRADGDAQSITATWTPAAYPLAWTRSITLDADGSLRLRYAVTNMHRAPLPFVWGLRVGLAWNGGVRIDIPRASRARVAVSYGEALPRAGSEFAWPALRDGGKLVDLGTPSRLGDRSAMQCYVELARGTFSIHASGASLEFTGDAESMTHAHVWVNNDAQTPGAPVRRWWSRRRAQTALAVGPALGAPGALSEAVGAWNAARWAEPAETVTWAIRCRPFLETP